jgi:hypothetical protein
MIAISAPQAQLLTKVHLLQTAWLLTEGTPKIFVIHTHPKTELRGIEPLLLG